MIRAVPLALVSALVAALAVPAAAQLRPHADQATPTCSGPQGALPKTWEGLAYAIDGNTLAGVGLKPHIRLWGIQVPELRNSLTNQETVAGMRARAALEDLLTAGEHRVSCQPAKWDRTCNLVAQCTITAEWPTGSKAGPHDIGLRLVEDGLAYGFDLADTLPWDKDAGEKVAHFESLARQARKGLWPEWLGEK